MEAEIKRERITVFVLSHVSLDLYIVDKIYGLTKNAFMVLATLEKIYKEEKI